MQARDEPTDGTVVALAALEIKTKNADHLVTTALGLTNKHRTDYFTVRGADRLFYEVVPNEYRGQLLHQAVVLRVNLVVFVMARTSGIIYRVRVSGFALAALVAAAAAAAAVVFDLRCVRWWCVSVLLVAVALASAVLVLLTVHGCQVLIHFSDTQCETYYNAVTKFTFVVNWCYDDTAPQGLPAEWVRMVESHLPLWKAARDYIRTHGVQPPMRTIKAAALCMYDIGKCGVDISTEMLNLLFRNPKHKCVRRGCTVVCVHFSSPPVVLVV